MSLDVQATSAQVRAMAESLAEHARRMRALPEFARELLETWHPRHDDVVSNLEAQEQGGVWPFAVPIEPLLTVHMPDATPANYAVVSTDGSQIESDAHGMVNCFLINVGWAAIAYGERPDAWLANRPTVHHEDQAVRGTDDEGGREAGDQQLSMLRTAAEIEQLADIAAEWRGKAPTVAVADGNLVRWELGGKWAATGIGSVLDRFTSALATFRESSTPICGYISRPNAHEVANAMAVLAEVDCKRGVSRHCARCQGRPDRLCEALREMPDRDLFPHLMVGEASCLFRSLAPVLRTYHADDSIVFCYVRLEGEVVRLEMPIWVYKHGLVGYVLAVVLDQCERGRGYPVALMEAHEQAVIHGGGRDAFRQLIRDALHEHDMSATVSGKRLSKDLRAV